jgi:methylase of polypeptide subunit release factors
MKRRTTPYEVRVDGIRLTAESGVFCPAYFQDSVWIANQMAALVRNKSILEIGTGVGFTAIACALSGAKVVATDINPAAVRSCDENCKRLNLPIDVRQGNLFEPIKSNERFDAIFWNHPWFHVEESTADLLQLAVVDPHYSNLERFVRKGKQFLNPMGSLYLGTAHLARIDLIRSIARVNAYDFDIIAENTRPGLHEGESLTLLICELRPL